jgi:hypothetical protein
LKETLEELEQRRKQLYQDLGPLGDFRRGTISANFRKCGKAYGACSQPRHPGHGPQFLWNATIGGQSRAQNLRLGPELEKVEQEVANYQRLVQWWDQWVEVNEKICQLRPARQIEDETELERLKKTLSKKFSKKLKRKSSAH